MSPHEEARMIQLTRILREHPHSTQHDQQLLAHILEPKPPKYKAPVLGCLKRQRKRKVWAAIEALELEPAPAAMASRDFVLAVEGKRLRLMIATMTPAEARPSGALRREAAGPRRLAGLAREERSNCRSRCVKSPQRVRERLRVSHRIRSSPSPKLRPSDSDRE